MIPISNKAIVEYQEVYKKEFGIDISFEEARTQGERLLRLFKLIYQPIPKDLVKENIKSNEK